MMISVCVFCFGVFFCFLRVCVSILLSCCCCVVLRGVVVGELGYWFVEGCGCLSGFGLKKMLFVSSGKSM